MSALAIALPLAAPKRVLHVGCGPYNPHKLHARFAGPDWQEVRFDIDPAVDPDITGDIMDMAAVETASFDGLFSSHNIEHLFAHQVPLAFAEFFRVLKPGGFALITCPDVQAVAQRIAENGLEEPAYHSINGPIFPLDILFGWGPAIARGNHFMAHRTGFSANSLGNALMGAGFSPIALSRGQILDLWAEAQKPSVGPS